MYAPSLPGCQSQGDTFEEAEGNIREAIVLYLSTLSEQEQQELMSKEIVTSSIDI